ncbi:hypothetical protein ACIQ9Q_29550 [Streptomyces sp. NPDC094438]|uniref:hypothetical protein n=1 Tax=Streptomyces sp. NPDC094438 TaxID=3366061 RepID=UPI00382B6CCD
MNLDVLLAREPGERLGAVVAPDLLEQIAALPPMQLLPVPKGWPGPCVMYDSEGTSYALFTRDDMPLDAPPSIRFPLEAPDGR